MLSLAWETLPAVLGLSHGESCVLQETQIGNVIPDVLLGRCSANRMLGSVKTTYVEAAVFACVEKHVDLTKAQLLSELFIAPCTADRAIQKLHRSGMVIQNPSGTISASPEYKTDRVEIVAVEFKIRRWREALSQAVVYRRFSNRAYAVMDENAVDLEPEMISRFYQSGVGLIVQSGEKLQLVVESQTSLEINPWRVIAAQKLAQRLTHHRGINFQCVYANLRMPTAKCSGVGCPNVEA